MAKKQIVTNIEIEKDIVDAIKNPPKESERSYKSFTIPAIIIVVLLVGIEFVYPAFILWFLLALIAFFICSAILNHFRLKNKIKNVTINDYIITTEVVHSTSEEHYKAETGRSIHHRRTEQINNHIIRFESGKSWRIPKELYSWNERLRQCDGSIYNTTHRGDRLIAVTEKSTGKIIVAYHIEVFEYKN